MIPTLKNKLNAYGEDRVLAAFGLRVKRNIFAGRAGQVFTDLPVVLICRK